MAPKNSYDEIPYVSYPIAQSHPDRLATLGYMFGMSPAPVNRCRVLELGCSSGGNLIPMACHLPECEFVGVDLSQRQVQMAQKIIKDLGLANIRITQASIMDVDASWGGFDYIICHGVFSWVPDQVQNKILSIASQNLFSHGIAYISYNTYPGWHMREMIRHMMLYHASQFNESQERIDQARALINFLAGSVPNENNHYGMLLKKELDFLKRSSDSYLFHDHMEEVNTPVYFHQFAERAGQCGLQYLCEANFSSEKLRGFADDVVETLDRINHDLIRNEQYMDFLRNRLFRQTLLCHDNITLRRDLTGDNIADLLVASSATPDEDKRNFGPGKRKTFKAANGLTITTDYPLTKAALMVLWDCWPQALDMDTLVEEANRILEEVLVEPVPDNSQTRRQLTDDLLNCYAVDVVEFHIWQADFITHITEKPRTSRLANYLAQTDHPIVNLRHEIVNLDPQVRSILVLLDGERSHSHLVSDISNMIETGIVKLEADLQANLQSNDDQPDDRSQNEILIREYAGDLIKNGLCQLSAAALLID